MKTRTLQLKCWTFAVSLLLAVWVATLPCAGELRRALRLLPPAVGLVCAGGWTWPIPGAVACDITATALSVAGLDPASRGSTALRVREVSGSHPEVTLLSEGLLDIFWRQFGLSQLLTSSTQRPEMMPHILSLRTVPHVPQLLVSVDRNHSHLFQEPTNLTAGCFPA